MSAVARSLQFHPGLANPDCGYLVYVGTPEDYARRLRGGAVGYAAVDGGALAGYLLMSQSASGTATHADSDAVRERIFSGGGWLVDQIGLRPGLRGRGLGQALLRRFVADFGPERMTAVIMHGPMRNERSLRFFAEQFGFRCIGEYSEGDGMYWGIHEWRSNGAPGDERYPLGKFLYSGTLTEPDAAARVSRIASIPAAMQSAITALGEARLDDAIRPGAWTARQVLHHVADATVVFYERIRLTLTEDRPLIKPFIDERWVELTDARTSPSAESLAMLSGALGRLTRLLSSLPIEAYQREMEHPYQGFLKLDRLSSYLDWHGRHHTAQISAMGTPVPR
jgi:GNAT superfamily N-acetyltransferase/uncharacterized damage-inducible protein DinB